MGGNFYRVGNFTGVGILHRQEFLQGWEFIAVEFFRGVNFLLFGEFCFYCLDSTQKIKSGEENVS